MPDRLLCLNCDQPLTTDQEELTGYHQQCPKPASAPKATVEIPTTGTVVGEQSKREAQ